MKIQTSSKPQALQGGPPENCVLQDVHQVKKGRGLRGLGLKEVVLSETS